MFLTLQNLRHYVSTCFGESKNFFDAKEVHPIAIQGIGQGNGAGPQIWAAISTVILNMLRNVATGGIFQRPVSNEVQRIMGFAFVDNTDLIICKPHEAQTAKDTKSQMQTLLEFWEGGIMSSGGQLEATKSYWYMIEFVWKAGDWSYKKKLLRRNLPLYEIHTR
jgi:hypothetical protein